MAPPHPQEAMDLGDVGKSARAPAVKSGHTLALGAVVTIGFVLRLRQLLFARSIWLDEATFANGVLDSGWLNLVFGTQPFVDPVGYVLLTKLGTVFLGRTELAFRWIAFAAGVAALVVSALLARRVFRTVAAQMTFTGLVALSPVLIYYSNEAQQYALDVLAALAVLWVFIRFEEWRHGFMVLLLIGVVFPWFSYASVLVLFGVGVALSVRWLRRRDYRRVAMIGSAWGLSALLSLVHARLVTRTEFLEDYWATGFAPFPVSSFLELRWYLDSAASIVDVAWFGDGFVARSLPTPRAWAWLILVLVAVGAVLLARRRPWTALALGVTVVANLIMSALALYPIGSRPGLYMMPFAFLLAVEPVDWAMARRSMLLRVPAAAIALTLLAVLAIPSFHSFVNPENSSDMKGALAFVEENREPGDLLVVHGWSGRAFSFYEPRFEFGDTETLVVSRTFDVDSFYSEIDHHTELNRTWVIFSHRLRQSESFVEELARSATLITSRSEPSAFLVALLDLSSLD